VNHGSDNGLNRAVVSLLSSFPIHSSRGKYQALKQLPVALY